MLSALNSGTVNPQFNQLPADAALGRHVRELVNEDDGETPEELAGRPGPPASNRIGPQIEPWHFKRADAAEQVPAPLPDLTPVQDAIYRALTNEYQTAVKIADIAKCDRDNCRRELANLKRFGLADHKRGVGYRRPNARAM